MLMAREQGRSLDEVRSTPAAATSTLWVPSDGRTRDEWLRCHGQPADVCLRTRQKMRALKQLFAAQMRHHSDHDQQPAARQSVIIIVDADFRKPVFQQQQGVSGRCLACKHGSHVTGIPKSDWPGVKNKQLTTTPF